MQKKWNDVVVTDISVAVYVSPNTGKHIHEDRPFHGYVFNDGESVKDYCFSDGRVMRTEANTLFYLPKHSSYHVNILRAGGCYAINFNADIDDEPFCIKPKNSESIKKSFKTACDEWRTGASTRFVAAMRAIYNAVYLMQKEQQGYMPNERRDLILPAIEALERDFTDQSLTVERLAALCEMSTVYFRKIFAHSYGTTPKEYMIGKRMEYARQLLTLGEIEVSEIATLCGYSEPCHFSREFKKRFGISPKHYNEKKPS